MIFYQEFNYADKNQHLENVKKQNPRVSGLKKICFLKSGLSGKNSGGPKGAGSYRIKL